MIDRQGAQELLERELGGTSRMAHAQRVAAQMESLARQLGGDPETWYLTGFLHDIDLPETKSNMRMHGIVAGKKLKGLLPEESIGAIMSHDPGPGLEPKTDMAKALVLCDVLDNTRSRVGMARIQACRRDGSWQRLKADFPDQDSHIEALEAAFSLWPRVEVE